MPNLQQFIGVARPPISIVNEFSAGAAKTTNGILNNAPGKEILSGALTATTLATSLSITGAGTLRFLALQTKDATARTVRAKVTIDGVVVFDATSSSISSAADGIVVAGTAILTGTANVCSAALATISFQASLLVQIASSLTETDKIATRSVYEVF